MSGLHPLRPEPRRERPLATLAPPHGPESLLVRQNQVLDRHRFLVAEAQTLGATAPALACRDRSRGRFRPDRQRFADPDGIRQMASFQGLPERSHLALGGIRQHHRGLSESPVQRLVDQSYR
jgi:hypothetical protein